MKCPVCKNEINDSSSFCAFCKFNDLQRIFVNSEDASEWMDNIVIPYRSKWESSKYIENATTLYNSVIATQMSMGKPKASIFSDVEYVIENDKIIITRYIATKDQYSIPASINGLPVSQIASRAFYGCKELEKITIPNTINHIGKEAFMRSGIREIVFPKSVLEISESTCQDCDKLTTVVVLGAEKIEEKAFKACKNLSQVAFADTLKHISNEAFFDCLSLKTIYIPASVNGISEGAFAIEGARQDPRNYKKWYVAEWVWNDDIRYKTEDAIRKFYFLGNTITFNTYNAPHSKMYSDKCIFYCNPGSDAQFYARAHNIAVRSIVWSD